MESKGDIFDCHIYAGSSLFGRSVSEDELQERRQDDPGYGGLLIPAKPLDYHYADAMVSLEAMVDRLVGWTAALRVDPWRQDEARFLVSHSDSPVLFLHPMEEQIYPTDARVQQLVEDAGHYGRVVMIAAGYLPFSHAAQLLPLIRNFPKQRFILTHGAQINICGLHLAEAFEIFERCDNTWFETSGIYRQDFIERAIAELGVERVLYGSGSPVYDERYERARIAELDLNEADRAAIFGGNARALLSLDKRDASEESGGE